MEVTFVNPGVDYMIERIMAFQTKDESAFWSDPYIISIPNLTKPMPQVCLSPKGKNTLNGLCGLFMLNWRIR